VFDYWNNHINNIVAESLSVIRDELTYFAERVNAFNPQQNLEDLGRRHMEFAFCVVNHRLERVEPWVRRRLEGLRDVWTQADQAGHGEAQNIPETIKDLLDALDEPEAFVGRTDTWDVPSP
jgi:hypothetical protein